MTPASLSTDTLVYTTANSIPTHDFQPAQTTLYVLANLEPITSVTQLCNKELWSLISSPRSSFHFKLMEAYKCNGKNGFTNGSRKNIY